MPTRPRSPVASARPLTGQIAVVAGATRGAGRGIARALGEAGATVYCTGRSTRGHPSPYNRPETIEETAELVTALGGEGVAVRVDHIVESEVEALFERIAKERGKLDILVDSVAGEDPRLGGWTPLWKTELDEGAGALQGSLLSHVITAKYAARLMIRRKKGLIIEVTEGDTVFGGGNVLSDLVKTGLKGLAVRLAEELRSHKVAALAVTPGFLRSESMLKHFGVTESNWRDGGKKDPNFLASESPLFIGRAVVALAQDKKVLSRTGDLTSSWELAREFGFTDAAGDRPDWGVHWKMIMPAMPFLGNGLRRHVSWLDRIAERARGYLETEKPKAK